MVDKYIKIASAVLCTPALAISTRCEMIPTIRLIYTPVTSHSHPSLVMRTLDNLLS